MEAWRGDAITVLDNNNVCVGEDKISNLPDEIIHHILTFLPSKNAMSTCILSKRWNYVCNSVPILDFRDWVPLLDMDDGWDDHEDLVQEIRRFTVFLNKVLGSHERPKIQKFCLGWDEYLDDFQVKYWITVLIKRKVEELFLSKVRGRPCFIFPLSLFTCDSLTVLDLRMERFNVPDKVYFPRLKVLRLRSMHFVDGFSPNKLVSGSPILEELSLMHCGGLKSEILCIENLALKNLYLTSCLFWKTTVRISSPNLLTITCGQYAPAGFEIGSFPSLVEADIDILSGNKFVLIKLFEKLANVKLLKMSGTFFQILLREADILSTDLPAYNNLMHLEVTSSSTVRRFFRFLELSPNLESIVFAKSIHFPEDDCWPLDPECLVPHLKSIKFMDFEGSQMELYAVKLFLKYARFLETVTIVTSPGLYDKPVAKRKLKNALEVLLPFPRPAYCVVVWTFGYRTSRFGCPRTF